MLNRQQLLLTFLNSGHSPSVLWFMLSLGSVSVWKTPAVLSLYMGCRQTPDASQKRTVPSSCLQTKAQQDIAQSRTEMSQWICFCFLVVGFFFFKKGGAVPTLWAAGLSAEGPARGSGLQLLAMAVRRQGGNERFNNNTKHLLLGQKQRNAALLTEQHSICDEQLCFFNRSHCTTGDWLASAQHLSARFKDSKISFVTRHVTW